MRKYKGRILAVIILILFRLGWIAYYQVNFDVEYFFSEFMITFFLTLPAWWIGSLYDNNRLYVQEQEEILQKLQFSEARFRIITENAHDLITLLDHEGTIVYGSPSYMKVLGYQPEEFIGNKWYHHVHPLDHQTLEQAVTTSIHNQEPFQLQFRQHHKTKGWIWSELLGNPLYDKYNNLEHMVVLTRDISTQKEYEQKLQYFAYHDSLTDLPNRRYFSEHLSQILSQDKDNKIAVMMLDIDDFKLINDQYGHDVGDRLIEEFGKRIHSVLRETDMVARLGGDEFIILLQDIPSKKAAESVAQTILQAIHKPWVVNDLQLDVQTSIGAVCCTPDISTEEALMKQADLALYTAKEQGKNSYRFCKV